MLSKDALESALQSTPAVCSSYQEACAHDKAVFEAATMRQRRADEAARESYERDRDRALVSGVHTTATL